MSRLPIIHICNTFFERELESEKERPLSFWMDSHRVTSELQTLPLLYAHPNDLVLVSHLPKERDPRLQLLSDNITGTIESWGASKSINTWAKEKNIPYSLPDWELVKEVNSKAFSFLSSPKLPRAELLQNEKDALLWIEKTPGRKVLKTVFGTAGNGHFHIPGLGDLHSFCKKEFAKSRPLIGEPWVERSLDFSTQWKDAHLLGATVFENTPNGTYRATLAGPPSKIFGSYEWALKEHLEIAEPIVKKIYARGFFGHLGVDAYVYGKNLLQPVVEINARKTMSSIALKIQQEKDPDKILRLSFSPKKGIAIL